MAINPNARYLVSQTESELPESTVLTPQNGLTQSIASGDLTLSLGGNLKEICNLSSTGIVVLKDVASTVTAKTVSLSSSGSVTITNPSGINGNFLIDATDNVSRQLIAASVDNSAPIDPTPQIDFVDSTTVEMTVTDNAGEDRIDVLIAEKDTGPIEELTLEVDASINNVMTMTGSLENNLAEITMGFKINGGLPGQGLFYDGTKVVFDNVLPIVSSLSWAKDPNLFGLQFKATPSESNFGDDQTLEVGFGETDVIPDGYALGYYLSSDEEDPSNNTLRFIQQKISNIGSVGLNIAASSTGVLQQTTPAITSTGTFELNMKKTSIADHPQVIRVNNASNYIYDTFVYDIDVDIHPNSPLLFVSQFNVDTTPSFGIGFNVTPGDDSKIVRFDGTNWGWGNNLMGTVTSLTLEAASTSPCLSITSASTNMPVTTNDTITTGFDVQVDTSPTIEGSCLYYNGTDVVLGVPPAYSGRTTILFAGHMQFPNDADTMTVYFNGPNTNILSLFGFAQGYSYSDGTTTLIGAEGNMFVDVVAATGGLNVTVTSNSPTDAGRWVTVFIYYTYP